MKDLDINLKVKVYEYDELDNGDRALVDKARLSTYRSYAPYSKFKVGAAVMLDNGEVVEGSNQENVAFPSGTCAERTAAFYAHSRYPDAKFVKLAIAARGTDDEFTGLPTAPCGACRQSLVEYEMLAGHDVPVLLAGRDRVYEVPSIKDLLPLAFTEF